MTRLSNGVLVLILLLLWPGLTWAQDRTISGSVADES
jgi:hypothetical protein